MNNEFFRCYSKLIIALHVLNTYNIRIMKKLTITVSEEVYEGLYKKIGAGKISRFLNNLARLHVVDDEIARGYKAMSEDTERETGAMEWSENLAGDLDIETW